MATPPYSPPGSRREVRGSLAEALVSLAETPSDASLTDELLQRIVQLTADLVAPASYASVTRTCDDAPTTVAMSSEIALAVDLAQYADQTGPCLDTLDAGVPIAVPDIAATMAWAGFREAALNLGLRASLSIPLFAGAGVSVAALNLYGHDPDAMAPLIARVSTVYDPERTHARASDPPSSDPGTEELVSGLVEAFAVRAVIQQALGIIMHRRRSTAEEAYLILRVKAAETGRSLIEAATFTGHHEKPAT
ncbi:GAF and ANTAR domain-containing protein [Micromonospora sp. MED01]|uniref:GAF and ANTAR domain-containing protein n=1 Tax=Micromonospora alfalfae TaxID=2911212 RepID=UPI001EE826D7|nr:GAF and ANTAR domain-containing protein [Micromonospora alfalfae]MCG5461809.1 GAF and ANTAR domain-containing protein [Micromonospora alfalfae]